MNTTTMKAGQFEFEDAAEARCPPTFLAILAAIPAQFRNARDVERQAKRLYAMDDASLGKIGLDREQIPARLLESFE